MCLQSVNVSDHCTLQNLLQYWLETFPWAQHLSEGLNGLTDSRKKAKNLVDSRKNWKILTVSRKSSKKELTVKEIVP